MSVIYEDFDLPQNVHDPVLEEFRADREAKEMAERAERKTARKIKAFAWLTSISMPILYLWSFVYMIGYSGSVEIFLLCMLVPPLIISIFLLRIITGLFYGIILNSKINHILRKTVIGIGVIAVAGFLYLIWYNVFDPNGSGKAFADEILTLYLIFFLAL